MKKNIILYLIYTFLSSLSFFSPFINLYLEENYKWNLQLIGIAILCYQISKFIFEVPTGSISDKYGRKISGIIGMVIIITSYLLLFTGNSIFVFISFFIKGIGYTFISGSIEAIFVDSIDEGELLKLNTIERVFFYTGFAASAFIGGFIIEKISYNSIIFLDVVILTIMTIIVLFMKDKEYSKIKSDFFKEGFIEFKKNKAIKYTCIVDFIVAFSFIGVGNFYSLFLSEKGVNINIIGIIIALQFLISSIVGNSIHNLFKNLNKVVVYNTFSILFICFTIIIYLKNINLFIVIFCYIISQVCFSIYAPIKYEMFQSHVKSDIRATILSIKSLLISLGGIISYIMISIMGDILDIRQITLISLFISLIMIVLINIKLTSVMKKYYKEKKDK